VSHSSQRDCQCLLQATSMAVIAPISSASKAVEDPKKWQSLFDGWFRWD